MPNPFYLFRTHFALQGFEVADKSPRGVRGDSRFVIVLPLPLKAKCCLTMILLAHLRLVAILKWEVVGMSTKGVIVPLNDRGQPAGTPRDDIPPGSGPAIVVHEGNLCLDPFGTIGLHLPLREGPAFRDERGTCHLSV